MTPFDSPAGDPGYTLDPPPAPAPALAPTPTPTPATGYTLDPPPAPAVAVPQTPAPPAAAGYTLDPPPAAAPAPPTPPVPQVDDYGRPVPAGLGATVAPPEQSVSMPPSGPSLGADLAFTPEDSPSLGGVVSQIREGSNKIDDTVLGAAQRFGTGWTQGGQSLSRDFTTPTFSEPTVQDQDTGPTDFAGRLGYGLARSTPVVGAGIAGATVGSTLGPLGTMGGAGLGMAVASTVTELRPAYVQARAQGMDHDAAVTYAIKRGLLSGAISGATAPLFELAPVQSMVGRLLFNSAVTAPAVGTAGRVITPAVMGEPMPSGEELGQGAISDALGGLALGGAFEGVRAAREGVRGEGFRMRPDEQGQAEPQPKAQPFSEMYPPEEQTPAPTGLLPAPVSAEPPAPEPTTTATPVPAPTPEPGTQPATGQETPLVKGQETPPEPVPPPETKPAPEGAPVPSQIRPDETGTGEVTPPPGATQTTPPAGADTGAGTDVVAPPAPVAPTGSQTVEPAPPSPVSPLEPRTPVDDHTPPVSATPAAGPADVPAASKVDVPGTDVPAATGTEGAQPVVGANTGGTNAGQQGGVANPPPGGEAGGGLAGTKERPVTEEEYGKLSTAVSEARKALSKAERSPAATPEQLDTLRQRVQTAQDAFAQAKRPPVKGTYLRPGMGPSDAEHKAEVKAHQDAVDARVHAEGQNPVPEPKAASKIFTMSGHRVNRGQDTDGHTWIGTGHAMVRGDLLAKAAAQTAKLKTSTELTVPAEALTKVVTPSTKVTYQPLTWERRVTPPDGVDQVIGTLPDDQHIAVQKPVYDALHAAAGADGTIVSASKGDDRIFARNAKGETVGVGMPMRMPNQAQARVYARGPVAAGPPASVPGAKVDVPGTDAPSRPAQILAELDARNAPDADYRAAFSTGSKEPLGPGETWRQRLVDWVERTREPTPEPEAEPPIFDRADDDPLAALENEARQKLDAITEARAAIRAQHTVRSGQIVSLTPEGNAAMAELRRSLGSDGIARSGPVTIRTILPQNITTQRRPHIRLEYRVNGKVVSRTEAAAALAKPPPVDHAHDLHEELGLQPGDSEEAPPAVEGEDTTAPPVPADVQDQLDKNDKQIAALQSRVTAIEDKGASLSPTEARELQAKTTQLKKLRATQDTLAAKWKGPRQRKRTPPARKVPGAPPEFNDYKMADGTSVYQVAFTDAGHDPRLATSYPIARQIEILRRQTMRQFGFKDVVVQGGKDKKETADQLLDLYRAAHDMMASLGLPLNMASLEGDVTLHLEVPKTGKRGYLGMYNGADRSIHLAGRANSFGHEWIHALDHKLTEQLGVHPQRADLLSRFTRKGALDPSDSVHARFAKLINTLFYDEGDLAAKKIALQITAAQTNNQGQPTALAKKAQAALETLNKGAASKLVKSSAYHKLATQQPGSYWAREVELLARAGEAWIARQMENNGVDPRGVVMPDEAYLNNVDHRLKTTFPKDQERLAIFQAFSDLFQGLRAAGVFSTPAAAVSRDFGMVDPAGYARLAAAAKGSAPRARPGLQRIGEWYRRTADAAARVSLTDKSRPVSSRSLAQRRALGFKQALYSKAGYFDAIIELNNPRARVPLQQLRDKLGVNSGSGRPVPEGFEERARGLSKSTLDRMSKIMEAEHLVDMDEATNDMLRHGLVTLNNPTVYQGRRMPDNVANAVGALRKLLNDHWELNRKAGLDIQYAKNGFFPRVYDHAKIVVDQNGFVVDAQKLHKFMFDEDVGPPGDDPAKLHERWRNLGPVDKELIDRQNPGLTADMKALAKNLARQAEIEALPPAAQTAAVQAELANLKTDAEQLAQTHHDTIGNFIAERAADNWVNRLAIGYPADFDTVGPSGNYLNHRVLPPEADEMMANWMVRDVASVLSHYFEQSSRKVAYAEHFGVGEDNEIERLLTQARKAGMYGDDGVKVRGIIESITGRTSNGDLQRRVMTDASNFVHAFGATALMGRAAWTSLHEPIVSSLMTGNVQVGLRAFAHQFAAIAGKASAQERALLADFIGVTTSRMSESLMTSRTGADYADSPTINRFMMQFYRTVGLTQLTNSIRRAVMGSLDWYLRQRVARDFLNQSNTPAAVKGHVRAQRWLNEMGIPPQRQHDFARWLSSQTGMPTMEELQDHPMLPLYSIAIRRLVDWSSQDPYKADRPMLAEDKYWRLIFQFGMYNYGFQRNVLNRIAKVLHAEKEYGADQAAQKGAGKAGQWAAGKAGQFGPLMGFAASAALLMLTSFLSTTAREGFLNYDKFKEHIDAGDTMEWLGGLAFGRAGLTGTLDPVSQLVDGLRYMSTISSLMQGAAITYITQNMYDVMMGITALTDPNAPETNTRAYNAVKGVFNLMGVPLMAFMANKMAAAGGPFLSPAAMLALQYFSTRQTSEHFAEWITGYKGVSAGDGKTSPDDVTGNDSVSEGSAGEDVTGNDNVSEGDGKGDTKKAGGQSLLGSSVAILDDFIAPAWSAARPILGVIPTPAKAALMGGAAAVAAVKFIEGMAPYRAQPKPP